MSLIAPKIQETSKDDYLEWVPTGPSFGQVNNNYVNKSVNLELYTSKSNSYVLNFRMKTLQILKEAAVSNQKAVI